MSQMIQEISNQSNTLDCSLRIKLTCVLNLFLLISFQKQSEATVEGKEFPFTGIGIHCHMYGKKPDRNKMLMAH
jgi:hypothetical protein